MKLEASYAGFRAILDLVKNTGDSGRWLELFDRVLPLLYDHALSLLGQAPAPLTTKLMERTWVAVTHRIGEFRYADDDFETFLAFHRWMRSLMKGALEEPQSAVNVDSLALAMPEEARRRIRQVVGGPSLDMCRVVVERLREQRVGGGFSAVVCQEKEPQPARATLAAYEAPAATTQSRLTLRPAARWYRRMNPQRNFPLSVAFSGKQMLIVGGAGLGITLGQQELVLDADHPVVNVEPRFPGCIISPPRADVYVSQEITICRFWITPLVCGDLSEACVTIRYRDKVVETLATPAQVVTRTTAKVLAVLGPLAPFATKALEFTGWHPVDSVRGALPFASDWLAGLGPLQFGLGLAGVLLVAALGFFYATRPLEEPNLLVEPSRPSSRKVWLRNGAYLVGALLISAGALAVLIAIDMLLRAIWWF